MILSTVTISPLTPLVEEKTASLCRPVYIECRVCVVKDVVKCSFEYLCVVHHDTRRQHNVGVGEGTIKNNS